MRPIRITYDPEGDILYITFGQPTASTGYELSDQLLLRVDPGTKKATGLTIFQLFSPFFGGAGDSAKRSRREPGR
jgi:uncharacterized protein YuzE